MSMWYPRIFRREPRRQLGVFVAAERMFFAEVFRGEEDWQLVYAGSIGWHPEAGGEGTEPAESIRSHCLREGIGKEGIAFCLSAAEVFCYQKVFPMLPPKELSTAVHWDLEAAVPFEENGYIPATVCQDEQENRWLLAAVSRVDMEVLQKSFQACGLKLDCVTVALPELPEITGPEAGRLGWGNVSLALSERSRDVVWTEELYQALYAALGGLRGQAVLEFLPPCARPDGWNWPRILAAILLAGFGGLSAIYGYGSWQLHALRQECQVQETALRAQGAGLECQRRSGEMAVQLEAGEHLLQKLSAQRFPWHALLVHLGTQTVEGVWITDIRLAGEGCIEIRGRAVGYEALSTMIARLEADRDFFTQGAVLQNSESREKEGIVFSLQIRL